VAQRSNGGSVSVLGPLRVEADGVPVALRPAQRRLLAILLLNPEVALDRDTLTDRMWGDAAPATAASAIQVHLSGIRKRAPGLLTSADGGYRVDLQGWSFDRTTFERLVAEAMDERRDGRWERALRTTERAAALWRGTPYEELADDDFAVADRARLMASAEELGELRAEALMAMGRFREAVLELEDAVQRHPLREPLWEQLMLARYRSGRQAEALGAFQEVRRVLDAELGVEPGARLRELEERIAWGDESLGEPMPSAPTNLPRVPTSFVGREDDLRAVADLLATQRVVTLVGGPGIGKSRLAIEAGHAALASHPDGVWLTSLVEARTEIDVAVAIARAVGITAQSVGLSDLASHLDGRRMLLVLDNCEHLIGPGAKVARGLSSTSVRILATSRRALGVRGEAVWQVGPLPPPVEGGEDGAALRGSAAVRLFVDRARAADRGYRLTPESAPLVSALCRRADGIPLALELAAAWIPWLGLTDIEEMLTGDEAPRRGGRGRPEHHRSLRAAIEWSLALLPPGDRRLFLAASIFKGTFDLGDVVAVCTARANRRVIGAAIARLVDASLLVARHRPDGTLRYHTLVPIREFAHELRGAEEAEDVVRQRFVTHYLGKSRGQQRDPFGEVAALERVDDDLDNLREAFELGIALGRADEVARALVPLDMYWRNRYLGAEGRRWCARVLPFVTDPDARAGVLASAAVQAQVTNDLDEALRLFRDAVAAYEQLDDPIGLGRSLLALAGLHCNRGEWRAGLAAARKGRRLALSAGNESAIAVATHWIGKNLSSAGDVDRGLQALVEAARLAERTGEASRASHYASTVAFVAVLSGNEAVARGWSDAGIALARSAGSVVRLARALGASAMLEARWGDPALARDRLVEVDGMLAHHEGNEHLFEFLFPAAVLLHRCQRWPLLAEVVDAVEAEIARTPQGYGEPWRGAAAAWKEEAGAALGASAEPRSLDAVTADVRRFLEQMA
jgi:predicted ATPase/DNA-binding SARP family transcriptional activator